MKKILLSALGIIGIACLGGAAACSGEPAYFRLTYEQVEGVSYDFKGIESGAEVKEGYVITFTCTKEEGALGDPVVMVNDNQITAGEDGVYSFTMTSDTKVTVTGVYVEQSCKVNFVKGQNADGGDNRVIYHCASGDVEEGFSVPLGTKVEFTMDVSVYYGDSDYTVLANTTLLNADDKGVYSFTALNDSVNITVTDLKTDEAFISRADGGSGTAKDPFIISRPIDLYVLADRVSDSFYNGSYSLAHYKMVNDIDMKGEQLFVIGDATTEISSFCGVFDGGGHTISNYYIDDTIIEQANFTEIFTPYIGMFGFVQANNESPAVIKNLNLENFTININAAEHNANFYVGGIAGETFGADIINCNASGKIVADADESQFGYIGGVVGFQSSAYFGTDLSYISRVIGCSSSVEISGESGAVYAAGGIAGLLNTYVEDYPSVIVNSHSSGSVVGAMHSGGIVGRVSPYSSVKNCYSTAPYVEALNSIGIISGSADYAYAYAGGIAGYVDYSSVVSHCFATSDVSSYAVAGDRYSKGGNVVGAAGEASAQAVDSVPALVFNNYSTLDTNAPTINNDFIKNTLGWSDNDWSFGEEYPEIKPVTANSFNVTVNYGDKKVGGNDGVSVALNGYLPISDWYKDEIAKFVNSDDGLRSYGYYFEIDGKLYKVPTSYVLTGGETLKAQFADYKQAAGKYYLKSSVSGSGIYINLSEDGVLSFIDGARQYTSHYTYDGENVYLYECPALLEQQTDEDNQATEYMTVGKGTITNGIMTVVNGVSFTQTTPLTALKEITAFNSGKYYSSVASDKDYIFNTDGTGLFGTAAMTYTVSGDKITITVGTSTRTGTIGADIITFGDGKTYTRYDMFEGVWEKSATTHKQYAFDGKGGWNYSYFGYNQISGKKIDKDGASGTYTVNSADQTINLYVGETPYAVASYDENGFLAIVKDGRSTTFYKQSSHVGVWRFAYQSEAIELTLGGVGADGFGKATIKYETINDVMDVLYDVRTVSDGTTDVDYVNIYLGNSLLGSLTYNTMNSTLGGTIFSYAKGVAVNDAVFCLYDEYRGRWISAENQLSVVDFNGFGQYKLPMTETSYATSGTVKLYNRTINYKLDDSTMDGSFTYIGYTYKLSYNEDENVIDVVREKEGEAPLSFSLHRFDSWYGTELSDDSGTVYTFNGGGTLPDGGVMTAGENKLTYKIVGDGLTVYDGQEQVGTIEIKNNSYIYEKADSTTSELSIFNSFTGSWTVGGGLDKTLVVGKINADGKAVGTYLGKDVTFTYDKAGKYLSFKDGDKTLYVLAMKAVGKAELAISEQNNTYGKFITCIKAENLDGLQGKYTAADGAYLVLDGFGTSVFGKGVAEYYDKEGKIVKSYTYSINSFGMPYLEGEDTQVLKPCKADEAGAYKLGDKAFVTVKPDNFYGAVAQDSKYEDNGITYTFNGVGSFTSSDGKNYTYTNAVNDKVKNLYTMDVVCVEDGKAYDGEFDYGSTDYVLQLKEKA